MIPGAIALAAHPAARPVLCEIQVARKGATKVAVGRMWVCSDVFYRRLDCIRQAMVMTFSFPGGRLSVELL